MSRFAKRTVLFICLVGLGLVLGMQLASSGMRSVYGFSWDQPKTRHDTKNMTQHDVKDVAQHDTKDVTQIVVKDTPAVSLPSAPSMTVVQVEGQNKAERAQTPVVVQQIQPRTGEASVDVMADKTAGLLQQASTKGIEWVVSVFDDLTN